MTNPDDHPIISDALYGLTVCGELGVHEIPRERAARLLDGWVHRAELSDRDVATILSRFPEQRTELILEAEAVLRAMGAIARHEAADHLRMFVYHADLTAAERASLLDRFPGIACGELLAEADSYTT